MQKLQDIQMRVFSRYLVDGDESVFEPDAKDSVIMSFNDITASPAMKRIVALENNIQHYAKLIEMISILVGMLKMRYDEDLCKCLRYQLNFNYPFTQETYLKDLEAVSRETKKYNLKLNEYVTEREKVEESIKEQSVGLKITYEAIARTTLDISKFYGYSLPSDIDAMSWAVGYSEMKTAEQKKASNGRKGK